MPRRENRVRFFKYPEPIMDLVMELKNPFAIEGVPSTGLAEMQFTIHGWFNENAGLLKIRHDSFPIDDCTGPAKIEYVGINEKASHT